MTPYNFSPEAVILTTIQNLLSFVRTNYNDCQIANTPNESYLYKVFDGNKFERYNYYEQAVGILITTKKDQRHFTVDLSFNKQKNSPPSAFISLGQEVPTYNGLGMDEGYNNSLAHGDTVDQTVYTRAFNTQFDLYIYSDQYLEVIVLYQLIRCLLISFTTHLEVMGLRNLSTPGKDIDKYPDFLPKDFFFRAISLRFFYETEAPSFEPYNSYSNLIFHNILKPE